MSTPSVGSARERHVSCGCKSRAGGGKTDSNNKQMATLEGGRGAANDPGQRHAARVRKHHGAFQEAERKVCQGEELRPVSDAAARTIVVLK